jgi:hypothetical protein
MVLSSRQERAMRNPTRNWNAGVANAARRRAMQRFFHSNEDQKLAHRWRLIVVTAYSTAALMIVLISALVPASREAGLEGLGGPAPGFSRGGLHARSQTYATVEARQAPAVLAGR